MNNQNTRIYVLSGHVRRHPYRAVLIAAGVGYVLGGGLFTRLSFNMIRLGLRVGALPLLRRELFDAAESALSKHAEVSS